VVGCRTSAEFLRVLDQGIRPLPGVSATETSMHLSHDSRPILPI
jgi:hypothetical protein